MLHRLMLGAAAVVALQAVGSVESAFTAKARTQNVVEAAPVFAPRMTGAPAISGAPTVADTLTASDGTWTRGTPTTTRRWLRCTPACSAIPGETDPTYLLTGDDAGATIKLEVTATNSGGSTTATSAATAGVARATLTQILCRNPDDGLRVGQDGVLPDGISSGKNVATFNAAAQCATTSNGLTLSTGGTWSASQANLGGWLQYRGTNELQFTHATLYRQGAISGNFSWAIATSTDLSIFATPRGELCSWGAGCTARGIANPLFGDTNRVEVAPGQVNGFNVVLLCDIPNGFTCQANGSQGVRIYGGKVTLKDTATPFLTQPATGTMTGSTPLPATASLAITAADAGSGLYRVRVRVGQVEVATRRLHDNGGRCADVNPANQDPFEFATRQPCLATVTTQLDFDTTSWPKTGRLRVYLEDAGRNTTTIVNRALP